MCSSENFKFDNLETVGNSSNTKIAFDAPFELEWIFGYNHQGPLINISITNENPQLVVTAGHVLQIIDCKNKILSKFIGHEDDIFIVDSNATGRFLASADKSSLINIWDRVIETEFPFPVYSIFQPYDDVKSLSKLAMSFHGKYLLTASNGVESEIKLWRWTLGNYSECDDTYKLPKKYGIVKSLQFNCNLNEMDFFVVTAENGVVFGLWDENENKIQIHYPARSISIVKNYCHTIFIENLHKAVSITDCGYAVVWNDLVPEVPVNDKVSRASFKKELIKSIKLCDNPIRVIKSVDNYIVIGDDSGKIKFYDNDLKILYWCPNHDELGSILTISFNICEADEDLSNTDMLSFDQNKFRIRNFFIGTSTGQIIYVDFLNKNFQKVWHKSEDKVTAIDVHPNKKLLICGNYSGRIFLYNYETMELVAENQINVQKEKSPFTDTDIIRLPSISVIEFSACGNHLFCALENGTLISFETLSLTILNQFKISFKKVIGMKFSKDSMFLACYDVDNNVILMNYTDGWNQVVKYKCHNKKICDIAFISNLKHLPRLVSLSEDRQLIEYDLQETLKQSKRLVIAFSKRIFERAVPQSITLIYNPKKNDEEILIADKEFKLRIYDKNTFEILHIFLGPMYDGIIQKFDPKTCLNKTSNYFVFATHRNICLYMKTSGCNTIIDSNPFRSMGIVGHFNQIKDIRTSAKNNLLFSIGENCESVYMWRIHPDPVLEHLNKGGTGLKPYCHLLPAGKYGNFFQDMQDLFYYMQLLADNSVLNETKIKGYLEASEVPDFLRGLGFYLSNYEAACISNELLNEGKRTVYFDDVVKIYLNYSPISEIEKTDIISAIKNVLASQRNISQHDFDEAKIKSSEIKNILKNSGEKVDGKDADNYLKEFFSIDNKDSLPDEIDLPDFINKLIGY